MLNLYLEDNNQSNIYGLPGKCRALHDSSVRKKISVFNKEGQSGGDNKKKKTATLLTFP